jgi:16S rRNA (uracil1498-N3)-methyltransferase
MITVRGPRIYLAAELTAGGEVVLPEGPARHVARVLRLGPGAPLTLFDGLGNEARAVLVEAERKRVVAHIESVSQGQGESPLAVHLGQAIYTEHGDVRLKGDREARKLAHWQAVAASACEQCGRATLPPVHPPMALADWLAKRNEPLRLVLHPGTPGALERQDQPATAALLIGPEGGLSDAEVESAQAAGFAALTLGPRILRTETAPVVALTLLQDRFGGL